MNYHNITKDDMLNGDGLRVVLWVAGCSHHCEGCQNPVTWNPNDGVKFDDDAKAEIFTELKKDYVSGLTLSGGDPLNENNLEDVLSLIKETKEEFPDKTIWIYSGYTWEEIMAYESSCTDDFDYVEESYLDGLMDLRKGILSLCDIFVDGRYMKEYRNSAKEWAGSDNQKVIDIKRSLNSGTVILFDNHI